MARIEPARRLEKFLIMVLGSLAGMQAGLAFGAGGLEVADCPKCHTYEIEAVQTKGGGHGTEVTCLDCHVEHPPSGTDIFAPCSRCHRDQPHFEVKDCFSCHVDPHMPLASLTFPGNARQGCISCHEKQGEQTSLYPSKHGELSCTFCHYDHDAVPDCLECHDPHVNNQTMADCFLCHPAHHPRETEPRGFVPVSFCEPCHAEVAAKLKTTTSQHGSQVCTFCHKGGHPPAMPGCRDCHGLPHGVAMHSKYPECLTCHGDPHQLLSGN